MPRPLSRRLSDSPSVLLVSSDAFICSVTEDALFEWGYDVHVVPDPTRSVQELDRYHSEIVILDLESLVLLDRELGELITQSLADSRARVVYIRQKSRLGANRSEKCGADAVLSKPFDCTDLRMSLEPGWKPPRLAESPRWSGTAAEEPASSAKIVQMLAAIHDQKDRDHPHFRNRKAPGVCRGLLAFKKRSA